MENELEIPVELLNIDDYVEPADTIREKLKTKLNQRRNTEKLYRSPLLTASSNNNNNYNLKNNEEQQRRHTIVVSASKSELFQKETKLIVLEFLQKETPRNEALTHRLRFDNVSTPVLPKCNEEQENEITTEIINKNVETLNNDEGINENKSVIKSTCKKRVSKKQRKISTAKSKTVTIGENERKQIMEELHKADSTEKRRKFKRSSSDLTKTQYKAMTKKFKAMQTPIIKWLATHVKTEKEDEHHVDGDHVKEELIIQQQEETFMNSSFDDEGVPPPSVSTEDMSPSKMK